MSRFQGIIIIIIIIFYFYVVAYHRLFLPNTSLELTVNLTAQASSFRLQ